LVGFTSLNHRAQANGSQTVGRILSEERLLVERYPEYREYARATRRMIPGIW
jgi:protein-S-isoprenylcysteine O-methyltransferase Ste14